jgi:hypothetical protein
MNMDTKDKIITLASFVYLDKINSFKNYLNKRFSINEDNIFQYSFTDNDKKILTFMVRLHQSERVDTRSFYPPTIIVHKKGECFYTINALNKLIESNTESEIGNLNYHDVKIDWDNYQNKMMITKNNELKIFTINRDFS